LPFLQQECIKILREFGGAEGTRVERPNENVLDESSRRQQDNMRVEFDELEMIDRIGAGTSTSRHNSLAALCPFPSLV
jgi:hypothetical protein